MATRAQRGATKKTRDAYLQLVQEFPLVSIKSDKQLEQAQQFLERLLAKGALEDDEEEYLDALSDLVALYEDQHHAIDPPSDAALLRHLLEAKGISQAKLSRDAAIPRSTISEILAGKRPFSRQVMHKLANYFNVDISVLAANL